MIDRLFKRKKRKEIEEACSVSELKEQRELAMESFRKNDRKRVESLADYFYVKFQQGHDVPFSLLDSMDEGKLLPMPVVHGGAIFTTKQTVEKDNVLQYIAQWTAGSTLTWHYHSDCYEILTSHTGEYKIYLPNNEIVIMREGDNLKIGAGTPHQVSALTKGKLIVDFIKI